METKLFEIIIMTFDKTKLANEDFDSAKKSKDLDADVGGIVVWKLIEINWMKVFDWIYRWSYKSTSFVIT